MELWGMLIGILITLLGSMASLGYWLGRKFSQIESRFGVIDQRFQLIDQRFQELESRLDRLESRIPKILVGPLELILDFMGAKGIISIDEADFLKKSCRAMLGLSELRSGSESKPPKLTQQQKQFVLKLLETEIDQITFEEIDQAKDIVFSWMLEEGDLKRYEALVRTYYTLSFIRAYLLGRGRRPSWYQF